jgi:predicted permease
MRGLRRALARCAGWVQGTRRDRELREELETHRQMLAQELIGSGLSESEAYRRAALRLGGIEPVREEIRRRRGLPWLDVLAQDLRYGFRGLARKPGFTTFTVMSLALGLGASTLVFSVVDALLLRPLPYAHPERMVAFEDNESGPDLEDLSARCPTLGALAGVAVQPLDFSPRGRSPVQLTAGLTSSSLPTVVGIQPALGRWFRPEEDRDGSAPLAVLSNGLWRSLFGSDPSIVGRTIVLSGRPFVVIGVTPPTFWLPIPNVDLWVSTHAVYPAFAEFRGLHAQRAFARLAPWGSLASSKREVLRADAWLEQRYPEEDKGVHRTVLTLRERLMGDRRAGLLLLTASVAGVMLLAAVNFANLLLARGESRRRELLIRGALGAGRHRIVRQLLTETFLLAAAGGAAGLAVAAVGLRALPFPASLAAMRFPEIAIDSRAVGAGLALALATGFAFGLVPALLSSDFQLAEGLKAGGRAGHDRRGVRLRKALIAAEFALALVLLTGGGLLLRSFVALERVAPGFRVSKILTARIDLPSSRYETLETQRRFRSVLLGTLNATPGVEAGVVSELPLSGERVTHNLVVEGSAPVGRGEEPEVVTRTVSPESFRILGTPILRGRSFDPHDQADSLRVAAVNEAFVHRFLGRRDPLGVRIGWAHETPIRWMTIVGVVGDIRHERLDLSAEPAVYDASAQSSQPWKRWMEVLIRSDRGTAGALAVLEKTVSRLDPDLPLTRVRTLHEVVAQSTAEPRFRLTLVGLFALAAILLACNGIYGVTSFAVTQEFHAYGIRMALGAQRHQILRSVLVSGGRLVAIGAGLGLLGARLAESALSPFLFGVAANDPLTLGSVVVLLAVVALAACWAPAYRATQNDPLAALRVD